MEVQDVGVHWVLRIAPVGVFALAFLLGSRTGLQAAGALIHYILMLLALLRIWISSVIACVRASVRDSFAPRCRGLPMSLTALRVMTLRYDRTSSLRSALVVT